MKKRLLLGLAALLLMAETAFADFTPTAYYILDGENQETTDVLNDAEAPLTVTFKANPDNLGDMTPSYEWRFTREGEEQPFLIRYEEETTYEFRQSGTTAIALYVSYGSDTDPELISTIRISISSSLLEVPNAFSPNGDGINDIFKVKENHKSIVEFKGCIFNRWGQKLFEWTDIDGGWDGTYHGSQVKAGVYFVLIKAKGADGREYDIKRDVNLLRGYLEETTTTE